MSKISSNVPEQGLTFILSFHRALETICRFTKQVLVHLSVDELENGNQAVFPLWILHIQLPFWNEHTLIPVVCAVRNKSNDKILIPA